MKIWLKITIIAIVVIVIGSGVYLSWRFFIEPGESEKVGQSSLILINQNQPTKEMAALKKISDQPVLNFWILNDTGNIFYFNEEGRVFMANEGADQIQSNQIINALNRAYLSPNQKKVLAAFGDPRRPQWGIFDAIDKIWRPLPAEIVNAAWFSNSDSLIAVVKTAAGDDLITVDLTKNPPTYKTIIKNIAFWDVILQTASPNKILIMEKPTGLLQNRLWQLDTKTLNFSPLFSSQTGLIIIPSTDKTVFFKFNSPNRFSILNQNFEEFEPLSFTTLPEKCTLKEITIYCFAPKEDFPNNQIMPDAYFQNKFQTIDSLVVFNFSTTTKTFYNFSSPWTSVINEPVDAINPQYLGGKIYFINRYDGFLYELTF